MGEKWNMGAAGGGALIMERGERGREGKREREREAQKDHTRATIPQSHWENDRGLFS